MGMMNYQQAHADFMTHTNNTGRMEPYYYGPSNALARKQFLESYYGESFPKSKASWGVFCRACFALYGSKPTDCIARKEAHVRDSAVSIGPKWPVNDASTEELEAAQLLSEID